MPYDDDLPPEDDSVLSGAERSEQKRAIAALERLARPSRNGDGRGHFAKCRGCGHHLGDCICHGDSWESSEPEVVQTTVGSLTLLYYSQIEPALDAADFVEGLLIDGAMSVVYGESGCGKTFFALDLALHVAAGIPWRGREVADIAGWIRSLLKDARQNVGQEGT